MSKITKNTKWSIVDDQDKRKIHAYHLTSKEALALYNELTGYESKTIEHAYNNTGHHKWMLIKDDDVFTMF